MAKNAREKIGGGRVSGLQKVQRRAMSADHSPFWSDDSPPRSKLDSVTLFPSIQNCVSHHSCLLLYLVLREGTLFSSTFPGLVKLPHFRPIASYTLPSLPLQTSPHDNLSVSLSSMPTHAPDRPFVTSESEIAQSNVACPSPLTPPPEAAQAAEPRPQQTSHGGVGGSRRPVADNTAAGMALMQEDTLYYTPPTSEEKMHTDNASQGPSLGPEAEERDSHGGVSVDGAPHLNDDVHENTEKVDGMDVDETGVASSGPVRYTNDSRPEKMEEVESGLPSPPMTCPTENPPSPPSSSGIKVGVPSIDRELDWSNKDIRAWDFSHRRLQPQYPSATFQPYSKFKGTQQSDRQIYNVEVTILTVDIEQSSMSGYLEICGLTPDHPTLTTFFTGEIIGGPDQKYSFRTRDPAWGASDKTDLTHWARFPAWRPLSLHAKRNINFVHPMNHENWWQQEHIYMRWKEHFLVPDYKLKSIQGASFEGFYYICFNQIEGRVSGIYFHSKSEK
jgi:hypothetical protein